MPEPPRPPKPSALPRDEPPTLPPRDSFFAEQARAEEEEGADRLLGAVRKLTAEVNAMRFALGGYEHAHRSFVERLGKAEKRQAEFEEGKGIVIHELGKYRQRLDAFENAQSKQIGRVQSGTSYSKWAAIGAFVAGGAEVILRLLGHH